MITRAGAEYPLVTPDGAGFGVEFGEHERMRERGAALFQRALLARGRQLLWWQGASAG